MELLRVLSACRSCSAFLTKQQAAQAGSKLSCCPQRTSSLGIITREKAPVYEASPGYVSGGKAAETWMKAVKWYMSKIGTKGGKTGGKVSTPAKRRASRENGKLGGRPRKKKTAPRS